MLCSTEVSTRIERDRRALAFITGIVSAVISLLVVPSVAGPIDPRSFGPTAQTVTLQTKALRQRFEFLRNAGAQTVVLSFTGLHQSFAVHHSDTSLRLRDCSYNIESDVSGLIDILLGAKIVVGYPAGYENYQSEARFGVYIGVESSDGIDLWFSNALRLTSHDLTVVGESHDRIKATAYKITSAPELRNELWNWARAHGHPRQDTVDACREIEKYDSPRASPEQ
jgi:hypothetical protein